MAKINMNNPVEKKISSKNNTTQSKGDKVIELINTGLNITNDLANIVSTISTTINGIHSATATNTSNLIKAENDVKKEENRHIEEMAKIEREWEKVCDGAASTERKHSFIKNQIEKFQIEYDRYLAMDTETFLSETVTSRLKDLRGVILDLAKELN